MKTIFSDRWALVAIFAAGAGFAVQLTAARTRFGAEFPDFRLCLAVPDLHHGSAVDIAGAEVRGPSLVRDRGVDLPVRGLPPAEPGDRVHFRGRFHRDGYVEIHEAQVLKDHTLKRAAMYVISIGVVIGLAVLVARRFRAVGGLFEERRDA